MKRSKLPSVSSFETAPKAPKCRCLDKSVLRQAWDLFVFSAAFALLFNVFYANGIKINFKVSAQKKVLAEPNSPEPSYGPGWILEKSKTPLARPTPTPVPSSVSGIQRIGLEGAKSRFDEKKCVFLDARPVREYQEGHIPGALNFYAEEFEKSALEILPQMPDKKKEIVTYCHGTDCDLSILLAQSLLDSGYSNVKVFFGGWPLWKEAGYPAVVGPNPFAAESGQAAEKKDGEAKPKSLARILFSDLSLNLFSSLLLVLWFVARTTTRSMTATSKIDWKAAAVTLIRFYCGFILFYASLDKLGNASQFSEVIGNYKILPEDLLPLPAVVIPWFEFFAGLFLILEFRKKSSALIFCALMGGYFLAIGSALARGIELNCGCINMEWMDPETGWTAVRDVLLFALGYIVLVSKNTYVRLDQLFNRENPHQ